MRKASCIIATLLLVIVFSASQAGNLKSMPHPIVAANTEFIGKWEGSEQCQAASAPVAVVVIVADGASQVFITGIYSVQGKIRGVVKSNTITIPRQAVEDPNFKNFMIEGSLTITSNHTSLAGVLTVLNNDTRDNCTVNYHK